MLQNTIKHWTPGKLLLTVLSAVLLFGATLAAKPKLQNCKTAKLQNCKTAKLQNVRISKNLGTHPVRVFDRAELL